MEEEVAPDDGHGKSIFSHELGVAASPALASHENTDSPGDVGVPALGRSSPASVRASNPRSGRLSKHARERADSTTSGGSSCDSDSDSDSGSDSSNSCDDPSGAAASPPAPVADAVRDGGGMPDDANVPEIVPDDEDAELGGVAQPAAAPSPRPAAVGDEGSDVEQDEDDERPRKKRRRAALLTPSRKPKKTEGATPRKSPRNVARTGSTAAPTPSEPVAKRMRETKSKKQQQPRESAPDPPVRNLATRQEIDDELAANTSKYDDLVGDEEPDAERPSRLLPLDEMQTSLGADICRRLHGPPDSSEVTVPTDVLKCGFSYFSNYWRTPWPAGADVHLMAAKDLGLEDEYRRGGLSSEKVVAARAAAHFANLRFRTALTNRSLMNASTHGNESEAANGYVAALAEIQLRVNNVADVLLAMLRVTHEPGSAALNADPRALVDKDADEKPQKPIVRAILYMLADAARNGYRRHGDSVWEQVRLSPDSNHRSTRNTRAWRRLCTIRQWVQHAISRAPSAGAESQALWNAAFEKGVYTPDSVAAYLLVCEDPEFQPLEMSRYWHSFENGIWNVKTMEFFAYDSPAIPPSVVACCYHDFDFDVVVSLRDAEARRLRGDDMFGALRPEGGQARPLQPSDTVAHDEGDAAADGRGGDDTAGADTPMSNAPASRVGRGAGSRRKGAGHKPIQLNFQHIPTPSMDRIIEGQLQKEDPAEREAVIVWFYVMLGRLLFEVGELDDWQILPFLLGRAGTGKSVILQTLQKFYRPEDVADISNETQKQFGLETIHDKYIWRCMEAKNDFNLSQTDLQSMVSGEPIVVMRKFKTALALTWRVPGIMAGNELPRWTNNSGSISRRIIIIKFNAVVDENQKDSQLKQKIEKEVARIMYKAAAAYHAAVREFGHTSLWASRSVPGQAGKVPILPDFFHRGKRELQVTTNEVASFLTQCTAIKPLGKERGAEDERGMPFQRFKDLSKQFAADNSRKPFAWRNPDRYLTAFEEHGIRETKLSRDIIAAHGGVGDTLQIGEFTYPLGTPWLLGVQESDMAVERAQVDAMTDRDRTSMHKRAPAYGGQGAPSASSPGMKRRAACYD